MRAQKLMDNSRHYSQNNNMKKTFSLIFIFLAIVLSSTVVNPVPHKVSAADEYVKGKGIVPVCNKGKLTEVPVLDADGKPVMKDGPNDTKVPLTEWVLGGTKCDFNQVMTLINRVIRFLLINIATPLAAIIFCYAGFKYLTSGGSEESTKKAKHMLINVVVGYIIALGAWLIINTILTSLGFNGPTFLG